MVVTDLVGEIHVGQSIHVQTQLIFWTFFSVKNWIVGKRNIKKKKKKKKKGGGAAGIYTCNYIVLMRVNGYIISK